MRLKPKHIDRAQNIIRIEQSSDRAGAWSTGQKANGKGLMLTAFRPARTILAHGKHRNPFRSK